MINNENLNIDSSKFEDVDEGFLSDSTFAAAPGDEHLKFQADSADSGIKNNKERLEKLAKVKLHTEKTIGAYLEDMVAIDPDHEFIHYADRNLSWSYGEFS
ncbi:MAG: hypothetical protein MJ189_04575, partial [Coriobacteriales bacterium]|nr:hypothetical protein [Coriobacteriales bacterium]